LRDQQRQKFLMKEMVLEKHPPIITNKCNDRRRELIGD
jgi:hypothetical protein